MKLPFWATILTALGVVVLCGLGLWQSERLEWKKALLERIDEEYAVNASSAALDPSVDLQDAIIKRGFLEGRYLHDLAVLIQPRTYEGKPGYHIVTPFKMNNRENVIFVNRGWIPIGEDIEIQKPQGFVKIIGLLRQASLYNGFVPHNEPQNDQWYRVDPMEIAKIKNIDSYYMNIFYDEGGGAVPDMMKYPVPSTSHVQLNNNHAQYMAFWFFMAVVLVGVYCVRFLLPQRSR